VAPKAKTRIIQFDAPQQDLLNRVSALLQEIGPHVRAGTDPAQVDTRKHVVLDLGSLLFALEEEPTVQLRIHEPDYPTMKPKNERRPRWIV
jgi:hypothetical protein